MKTDSEASSPPKRRHPVRWVVTIILVLSFLAAWSWVDSSLKLPVISSLVCSAKGGVFYDEPNALVGVDAPGCYRRPLSSTDRPPSTAPSDAAVHPPVARVDQFNIDIMQYPVAPDRAKVLLRVYTHDMDGDGIVSQSECEAAGGHFARAFGSADGWRVECFSGAAD